MSISKKFTLYVFIVIVFLIGSNLLLLQYFSGKYFQEYVFKIETFELNGKKEVFEEVELLDVLLKNKKAASGALEEYEIINNDLSTIIDVFEKYVENDPIINSNTHKIISQENTIQINEGALISFFINVFDFSVWSEQNSAIYNFVIQVLRSMVIANIFLFLIIFISTNLFARWTFSAITSISKNISKIANHRSIEKIHYTRNDEFKKLIQSINNLSEQLYFQENIRSKFLADISHEIKTPVTTIKCYLEGIQDGIIPLNEENTKSIIDEMDRLTRIIQSLMEYQKFEYTDLQIKKERFNIIELFQFINLQYANKLTHNGQKIIYEKWRPFFIYFDKDGFVQIIHNIFSNFIRYAGKNTTLFISYKSTRNGVQIIFEDNGIGVKKEEVPFLREKFYQSDASKSGDIKDRGIGVGLSIIQKISDALKSEYKIESDLGKWFKISLFLTEKDV